MTIGGWLLLAGSWSVIIGLNVFCLVRMLGKREPSEE